MKDNFYNHGPSRMAGNTDPIDQLAQAADELHGVAMAIRLIVEQMKDKERGQT